MSVFVIMPFGDDVANDVYEYCTKPICENFSLEVKRADEIFTVNPILDDILMAIKEAKVIIADISGKNPNVYYELGIAHILKQNQTIMVTHDDYGELPFDISHFRIIKYKNTISGKTEYESKLNLTLINILKDYRKLYKKEYDFVIEIMQKTNADYDFFFLMALDVLPKPVEPYDNFSVSGDHKIREMEISGASVECAKDPLVKFELFDYVNMTDIILLTEKGKDFVNYLRENGYYVIDIRDIKPNADENQIWKKEE